MFCSKCGKELNDDATICPNCNNKIVDISVDCENDNGNTQLNEIEDNPDVLSSKNSSSQDYNKYNVFANLNRKFKQKSKKKKILIISIILLLIVAIIGSSVGAYNKKSKDYDKELAMVTTKMINSATEAQECSRVILNVWYKSIFKEHDSVVDRFTCPYGVFVDFSTAISNLLNDEGFNSKIENLKKEQSEIRSAMKKLRNPPAKFKELYKSIKNLYNVYIDLTDLVINPDGSYQTYSKRVQDVGREFLRCANEIISQIS